jgi:hypothetical protein
MKSKDEIYQQLKANIINSIPSDWEKAVLEIRVAPNFSSYNGYYLLDGERKSIKVSKFDLSVDNDLLDLHLLTTEIEKEVERWNRAFFTLLKNQSNSIEFTWDQELYDSVYGEKSE